MTFKEIKKLRSEICLGSCFISDYENSLGYTPESVCDLFDGYVEFINDKLSYNEASDDKFDEYDNDDTLYEFWSDSIVEEVLVAADADYIANKYYDGYIIEESEYNVGHGEMQPCINVYRRDDPDEKLTRFVPYYHPFCHTTVLMETFFGDEFEDEVEIMRQWEYFTKNDAYRFVKGEVYY